MEATGLKATTDSRSEDNSDVVRLAKIVSAEGITGKVCCDSRRVSKGDVFVAVRGVQADGHDFIAEAVGRGATTVVVERPISAPQGVKLVQVENSAAALGYLAQAAYGGPTEQMKVLGVTGTNGKTTVAYLVREILRSAGLNCGMVGTVEYNLGDGRVIKADNTTPDAVRLAEMMGQMRDKGLTAAVMECSSHGLDQERTAGIKFSAAAFTNLSGDHLDYHGTEQEYLEAKSKLFRGLDKQATAVLNGEDPASNYLAKVTKAKIWRYGFAEGFDLSARIDRQGIWGSEFILRVFTEKVGVQLGLIGAHNVSNCLAAAGIARSLGVNMESIATGIKNLATVPGRLERVEEAKEFAVLVDYAHTDDALRHSLATVRELAERRVILVFGCGGERDRSKRPRMAQAAQKFADRIIVTNDNPRREDAQRIRAEIQAGFSIAGQAKAVEIADRAEAIVEAIAEARPGDVVLIAGKGHEDYQVLGEKKVDFDDREVAKKAIKN